MDGADARWTTDDAGVSHADDCARGQRVVALRPARSRAFALAFAFAGLVATRASTALADPPPAVTSEAQSTGRPNPPPNAAPGTANPLSSAAPPATTNAASSAPPIDESGNAVDYVTPRYEPAGFPLIGGNSDIGVLLGVAGTLSRFEGGARPYFWNMDVVVSASVKAGPNGPEMEQQNYRWQWDIPGLFNGRLRLNPAAYYQRTINQGYYGVGDASPGSPPAGADARYFQFVLTEARVWNYGRIMLGGPLSVAFATIYRYTETSVYPGSQLAIDAATPTANRMPLIRGLQPLSIGEITASLVYDTRDNEIMPARGLAHQVWLRVVQGFPQDANIGYGAFGFSLCQYLPLGGPFIFASRLLGDFEFGNVPFYDLFRGGTPFPVEMIGGGGAVRGVPSGRYLGLAKLVANLEVRALLVGFHIFGQSFRIGANLFFDAGRSWTDYTFHNALDGNGLGIKYGVGVGGYLRWGQAAIFRAEIAYSPDAASENPGFPFGIYVEDGVMF